MKLLLNFTFVLLITVSLAHPGHGDEEDAPAGNSTLPANSTSLNGQKAATAWSISLFALVGTFAGAIIPLIDEHMKKVRAKPSPSTVDFAMMRLFRFEGTSPRFVSGALGFSSGVLLFGALTLVIPGCIKLFTKSVGKNASMVVFACWFGGCLLVFLARVFQEALGVGHHHHHDTVTDKRKVHPDASLEKKQPVSDNASLSTRGNECANECECVKHHEIQINKSEEADHLLHFGVMNMVVMAFHKIPEVRS
jgi:zinc transporter ZupT